MWAKMLGIGSNWNHQSRVRESLLQHSCAVPAMSLLIKDHKGLGDDGMPSTRPVVSACQGMNTPLSDVLSEVLEPIVRDLSENAAVLSSENMPNLADELK